MTSGATVSTGSQRNLKEDCCWKDGCKECGLAKMVEFKDIDAEAIEPEDLEPRRIELDRNLGTNPRKICEKFSY